MRKFSNEEVIKLKWINKDGSVAYNVGNVRLADWQQKSKKRWSIDQLKIWKNYQSLPRSLENITHIDEERVILKPSKEYQLVIDYPVTNNFIQKIKGPKTLREVVDIIAKSYKKMYDVEELTSTIQVIPKNKRKKLLNRNKTDGKYGIWGHDLDDLNMHTIIIKGNKIYAGIDS